MRRDGQRHGPRRIAKHPEQSGLLPLTARKRMSSELGLVCLDDLRGRDAYEEKRKRREKKGRLKRLVNNSWILPEQ